MKYKEMESMSLVMSFKNVGSSKNNLRKILEHLGGYESKVFI